MSWASVFERASRHHQTVTAVCERLDAHRAANDHADGARDGDSGDEAGRPDGPDETGADRTADRGGDPTRIVADADVLVADLLVGGRAREALDHVRSHTWLSLIASDRLLDDAAAVVAELADAELATDWRERVRTDAVSVDHPAGDHPGLASAYRGGAAHLVSFDEELGSAAGNLALQPHMRVSIRTPDAFAGLFDPAALYEATQGDAYPGPDRDPRG